MSNAHPPRPASPPGLPPKRGRPRDPERMRRVLEAAASQFIELGFERTSVDSVAQASGVSKMTVYSYFPSKEALFDACISQRCNGLFDLFLQAQLDPAQPQDALTQVGTLFLDLMRHPDVLAMHRMMFASAATHPELCASFYAQGPAPAVQHLARYLEAADQAGALQVPHADRAANQFLSLFLGSEHLAGLLGLPLPDRALDAELVDANVAMFLRAHQRGA